MWLYLGLLIKFRASCMTYRVDINFKKWWDRKLDQGRFLSKEMRTANSWKGWMFISCCFLDKLFPEVLKSLHFLWIGKKWECGVFTHQLQATSCVCVSVYFEITLLAAWHYAEADLRVTFGVVQLLPKIGWNQIYSLCWCLESHLTIERWYCFLSRLQAGKQNFDPLPLRLGSVGGNWSTSANLQEQL